MLEMMAAGQEFFKFVGTGLYVYIAILSMIFILVKDKKNRAILAVFPAILLIIFFNPIFIKVMYYKYFFGTYWRVLWLFPATIINAYAGTRLIFAFKDKKEIVAMVIVVAAIIVCCGKLIYNTDNFSHRKNWYKLPRCVVEIGYNIEHYSTSSWYPTIIVPNELYCSMRQYSSFYRLLYGRNAEGYMSGIDDDEIRVIYEEMCKKEPDIELIAELAKKHTVYNIIFNSDYHVLTKNPEDYGVYYIGSTDNYDYYQLVY